MATQVHPLSLFKFCPKCGSSEFLINNFKSKRCNACKFIYYFNASSSTVAIIVNDNNELLVATRANEPAKGTLDLPGGFVDLDETAEDAVCREVKEETDLDVLSTRYLFSLPNRYVYSGFEVQTTDLCFLCTVNNPNEFKANDDVAKLQYIPIKDLEVSLFGLESIQKAIEKIKRLKLRQFI